MALPPLPANKADTWEIGAAFENEGSIMSVSAGAGRVLVGGSELLRMRAGDQGWQKREVPARIGTVWKVAQEPRAPWRQAVASESGVAIFLGKEGDGRIAHIRPVAEDVYVTNLAWGRAGQKSVLFVLWDNGEVVRLVPEEGKQETLALPPMAALAADGAGSVAMLAWEGFNRAKAASYAEAALIGNVYHLSAGFPEPERSSIGNQIMGYARHVVTVEWPEQAEGRTVDQGSVTLGRAGRLGRARAAADHRAQQPAPR